MHFVFLHVRILARGIKNKYLNRFLTFPIKEALRQAVCSASPLVRLFPCHREMWCLRLMIPNARSLCDQSRVWTVPVLSVGGRPYESRWPGDRQTWPGKRETPPHTVCELILAVLGSSPPVWSLLSALADARAAGRCAHVGSDFWRRWVKPSHVTTTEFQMIWSWDLILGWARLTMWAF